MKNADYAGEIELPVFEAVDAVPERVYRDEKTGLRIRFDKGAKGERGYGGKDHYHIFNPDATGKSDYYLNKFGEAVAKNSKASHILPE